MSPETKSQSKLRMNSYFLTVFPAGLPYTSWTKIKRLRYILFRVGGFVGSGVLGGLMFFNEFLVLRLDCLYFSRFPIHICSNPWHSKLNNYFAISFIYLFISLDLSMLIFLHLEQYLFAWCDNLLLHFISKLIWVEKVCLWTIEHPLTMSL